MLKRISLFYIQILLLYSCSQSQTDPKSDDFETGIGGVPTLLPLVEGACDEGLSSLNTLNYWVWNGRKIQSQEFENSFWTSTDVLKSPAIFKTLFAYQEINKVKSSCEYLDQVGTILKGDCIESTELTSSPKLLKVCSQSNYPRKSIESTALSASASIETAYNFYRRLFPQRPLTSLALLILPDIRFKRDNGKELSITDNAGWVLSNKFPGISQYMVFYPMSESSQASGKASYWEVPWIVAHEYGHHLFYDFLGPNVKAYFGYLQSQRNQFTPHEQWFTNQAPANVDEQQIFTGINEAFADLIAHYSQNNSSLQIASLSCRFAQRDVASPYLNDGSRKQFRFEDFSEIESDNCRFVDQEDVHTIGSILAYFIDQFFISKGLETNLAKGRQLFALLESLSQLLTQDLNSQVKLQLIARFVDGIVNSLGGPDQLDSEQCQLITSTFGTGFTFPFSLASRYSSCQDQKLED